MNIQTILQKIAQIRNTAIFNSKTEQEVNNVQKEIEKIENWQVRDALEEKLTKAVLVESH